MALVVVAVAVGIAVIVVVAVGTAADVEVLANSSLLRPMLDGTVAALAGLVVVTEGFSDASVLTTMT